MPEMILSKSLAHIVSDFQKYKEQVKVIKFCKGLNEKYSHVRPQIMLIEPLPILSIAFSLVLVQEHQLNTLFPLILPREQNLHSKSNIFFH